jgi:colicin import membrane protein
MALKKKTVAKSADAARKGAMTATVVKKVSSNVKVLKPGSKPLTQTLTEKRAIMEKAQGRTPAVRAKAKEKLKVEKKNIQRGIAEQRRYALRGVTEEALRRAGFDASKAKFGDKPTAAQTKAANKAKAEAERRIKEVSTKAKAEAKAERAARAKAARQSVGGGGLRGGFGMGGGGGSGRSNVNR